MARSVPSPRAPAPPTGGGRADPLSQAEQAIRAGVAVDDLTFDVAPGRVTSQQWDIPLNLMPSGATNAMLGITSPILFATPDPWAWWQGLLVLAGWCLVPAGLGALFTVRRDVT
jgi:hypothetical protein